MSSVNRLSFCTHHSAFIIALLGQPARRDQAVRLPKEYRFEGDEVLIKRVGDAVVLLPRARSWDALFQSLEQFEPGFKLERGQPKAQQKRAGLKNS